jgi:hypothetical protein
MQTYVSVWVMNLARRLSCFRLGNQIAHDKGYTRIALTAPLNPYQARSLERTQRAALGIRLNAPFLQHQAGNREGIGPPKLFKVPERQPHQQSLDP